MSMIQLAGGGTHELTKEDNDFMDYLDSTYQTTPSFGLLFLKGDPAAYFAARSDFENARKVVSADWQSLLRWAIENHETWQSDTVVDSRMRQSIMSEVVQILNDAGYARGRQITNFNTGTTLSGTEFTKTNSPISYEVVTGNFMGWFILVEAKFNGV